MSSRILLVLVVAFLLFIVGAIILANYSTVKRSYLTLDQTLTVQGSSYGYKLFNTYESFEYTASFTVLNGSIRSCFPLQEGYFDQWQRGQYAPIWESETSYAEYEIKRAEFMPGTAGAVTLYFFAFNNEDPSAKEINVRVIEHQSETDPVNTSVGVMAILGGLALTTWTLFTTKRPLPERRLKFDAQTSLHVTF